MAAVYPPESRPRRRWGRRLLITLIVLLIVIGVSLVVLDRFAASFAEREIGNRVTQEAANQDVTFAEPKVTIAGVPFLTQVVAGKYQQIKIVLRDFSAPANGKTLRMSQLDIRADDVRAPLDSLRTGQGDIVATRVSGTGTMDYASVAALIGRQGVTLGERAGRLTVSAPLQALGRTATVNGTANLTVAGDVLRFRFEQMTAPGLPPLPLVQELVNAYAKQISIDIKLQALPLQMRVQKVEPRPEGLVITFGADEVPLNRGSL